MIIQTAKLFKNSDEYIFHIYGPDFSEKDKLNDFIKMNNLNNIQIKESLNEKEIINKFKSHLFFYYHHKMKILVMFSLSRYSALFQ